MTGAKEAGHKRRLGFAALAMFGAASSSGAVRASTPDPADGWREVAHLATNGSCWFETIVPFQDQVLVLGAGDGDLNPIVAASRDGLHWTIDYSVGDAPLCEAGTAVEGGELIATGDHALLRTNDGKDWRRDAPAEFAATELKAVAGLRGVLVAGGDESTIPTDVSSPTRPVMWSASSDGRWTKTVLSARPDDHFFDVVNYHDTFVAILGDGVDTTLVQSSDGIDWTQAYRGSGGGHRFVATPDWLVTTGEPTLRSFDGRTWSRGGHRRTLVVGWTGSEFLSTGYGDAVMEEGLWTSKDAVTWRSLHRPRVARFSVWSGIGTFDGRGLVVGSVNGEPAIWLRDALPGTDANSATRRESPHGELLIVAFLLAAMVGLRRLPRSGASRRSTEETGVCGPT